MSRKKEFEKPTRRRQPGRPTPDDPHADERDLVPKKEDLPDSGVPADGATSNRARRSAAKRTKIQRERDLAVEADLYLRGWYQHEIATYLSKRRPYKLSQMAISYDLKDLRQRWVDSAMLDLTLKRAEEVERIDKLEREYWAAWEASQEPQESHRVETTETDTKVVESSKESTGDPRFLKGIQWCISRRIELFGLDAPKKMDVRRANVNLDLNLEKMSADELEQLEQILGKAVSSAGEGREGPPGTDPVYDVDV